MGLKLIVGRAGSGKSTVCLEELAEKQKKEPDRTLILIVPEQFSLQAERDLSRKTGEGILSATVLSFGRLAHRVFGECGVARRLPLTDMGKAMVLRKVLMEERENLVYFRRSVDKNGFLDKLSLTVSECFQYAISPDRLEELRQTAREGSILQKKLTDLCRIYQGYQAYIEQGYLSADETLDLLAGAMKDSKFLQGAEVWLDGFYGFTPQEYRVIQNLLWQCQTVTVTLTMDEQTLFSNSLLPSAPFFEPWDTSRRLRRLAQAAGAAMDAPLVLGESRRFQSPALSALEAGFFAYQPKAVSAGGHVLVRAAADRYEEAETAAREILRLVREEGYRYRDIALMTRALEDYGAILPGVFARYGIPCFLDSRREVLSHPLMELVRNALTVVGAEYPYEALFRYLKTGLTDLSREEIDGLENHVLAKGLDRYRFRRPWRDADMEALRLRVTDPLEQCLSRKKQTVRRFAEQVYALITRLPVAEKLDMDSLIDRQSWKILIEVLDNLVGILGDKVVSIQEFAKLLDAGLSGSSLGLLPSGVDRVIIGDIERTRFPEIRALFVLGVNDGVLPSVGDAEGLFAEVERETLTGMGVDLAHGGSRRAFEEQFLIYTGLTKPREKLILSYALGDLNGKAMQPSAIIHKIERLFPDCRAEEKDDLEGITVAGASFRTLGQKLSGEAPLSPVWQDALGYFMTAEDWAAQKTLLLRGLNRDRQEAPLKNLRAKALYASVSRLEKYVSCPYAYFLQYGLQAKERREFTLATPDLGSLFHSVLEWVSRTLASRNLNWRDLTQAEMDALVEEGVDALAPELQVLYSTAGNQYLVRRLKRIAKRAVWALSAHIRAGSFEPLGYEIGFGRDEMLPPIDMDLPSGKKMRLFGKIDRVDILEQDGRTYVKIIDYKSGSKAFQLQDVYYGLQLQLLLYLDTFLKEGRPVLGKEALCPGGVFYFRIQDPVLKEEQELEEETAEEKRLQKLRLSGLALAEDAVVKGLDSRFGTAEEAGFLPGASAVVPLGVNADGSLRKDAAAVDEAAYAALLRYAVNKAAAVGDSILSGSIPVAPAKTKEGVPCRYCSYHAVCQFDTAYDDFRYQNLKKLPETELWERIKKGGAQ